MSWWSRLYRNDTAIDFPSLWRKGAIVSGVLMVVFVVALLTRGLDLGIEFEGGVVWEVDAPGVTVDEARSALRDTGQASASIQLVGEDTVQVRAELAADAAEVNEVTQVLADLAGTSTNDVTFNDISPSWGDEVTNKARTALIVFIIVLTIYLTLRLHWRMAAGAMAAVVHDIVMTVGVYALFQFEVSPATVIAFLTILGYSLYDTLIVFDKVRENEARTAVASKLTATELISLSLNQVFARSMNTTITSVLPVLSVLVIGSLIMGAVVLQAFAIALLVGLIAGAYSSVFIATPVVALLAEREPANIERRQRLLARSASREDAVREARSSDRVEPPPPRSGPEPGGAARPAAGRAAPGGVIPPRPRKQKRRR